MKMITVQIAYEVPAEIFSKIEAYLADVVLRDVNWNGAEFKLERDDFTCIPGNDSISAVILFNAIQAIIRGE